MKIIKNIVVFLCVAVSSIASAQDFPYFYFTHVQPVLNNPSIAGSHNDFYSGISVYNLWAGGFKPQNDLVLSLSFSPGNKNKYRNYQPKVGLGLNLLKEQTGPFNHKILHLIYAYHLPLDNDSRLSFGICGILENLHIDLNKLQALQNDDPRLLFGRNSTTIFDGGFGITYYQNNFEIYLSGINLAPATYDFDASSKEINNYRKFFVGGSYSLQTSEFLKIVPFVQFRNNRYKQLQFDSSLTVNLRGFEIGTGYRLKNSVFVFAKIPFNNFEFTYTSENPVEANHMLGRGHTFSISWQTNFEN